MGIFDSLLSSIKDKLDKDGALKQTITATIKHTTGLTVEVDAIDIKHNTLYLSIPPTAKLAITLHKEKLLQELKELSIYSIN